MVNDELTTKKQRIEAVFGLIAEGESVTAACASVGVARSVFYREILADRNVWDAYTRAREACAEVHFDEIADLEAEAKSGGVDPQTFRVLLDSKKWRLGKMNIRFSDKQVIEQKTTLDATVQGSVSLDPSLAASISHLLPHLPELPK